MLTKYSKILVVVNVTTSGPCMRPTNELHQNINELWSLLADCDERGKSLALVAGCTGIGHPVQLSYRAMYIY